MDEQRHGGRRRRILLYGINYAPEQTGIAVQTTGLAEALAEHGWDVTVVTGMPHYPSWRREATPQSMTCQPVTVIRRNHYIPSRPSVLRRATYEVTWLLSCLDTLVSTRPTDVVLGITPSLSGAVLAAAASQRYGVPCVLMVQDLLGKAAHQSQYPRARLVANLASRVELSVASRAARILVVAEGFRDFFIEGGVPATVIERIRNPVRISSPTIERNKARGRLGWRNNELVVLHAGNMGYKQALETVLHSAALAQRMPQIRFVLQGDGNRRVNLEALAQQLHLTNVTFLPLISEEEFPNLLTAADILLLNQGRDVKDMSLPGKISSYFSVGRPVVAAVARNSETARELEAAGAGIVVEPEEPPALLDAIEELATDFERRNALGAAGKRFAESYLGADATACELNRILGDVVRDRWRVSHDGPIEAREPGSLQVARADERNATAYTWQESVEVADSQAH